MDWNVAIMLLLALALGFSLGLNVWMLAQNRGAMKLVKHYKAKAQEVQQE